MQAPVGERRLWGNGCGAEATRLICEYGFILRSLHSVKVEVNRYNHRATRLKERAGFRLVGRPRGALLLEGHRYDQLITALLRTEPELQHVRRFHSLTQSPGTP